MPEDPSGGGSAGAPRVTPPATPPDAPEGDISGRGSRALGARPVLISTASTIVFLTVVATAVALAPGAAVVRERFFNGHHLRQAFTGTETSPSVFEAFGLNVKMFLIAEVLILIFALVLAVIRSVPGPVFFPFRAVAVIYTDLFRGIPLILVLYILGFGVPALDLAFVSHRSDVTYGVTALVLVYSAYVAEVYRAGIDSVHSSQSAAARSLGLTRWKTMRFVVLPQAVRRVIPPLLNDFIGLQKDTALVSVLGSIEATRAAQIYGAERFNYASFVIAAVLFVAITIPLARFTDHLIARGRKRRQAGALT